MSVLQSTQFEIKDLSIVIGDTYKLDIRPIYEEINIYENVMFPCMSGSIVLRDATGLSARINFNGSQKISMNIMKDSDSDRSGVTLSKTFIIYKQTDRKQVNQNTEIYTLHFVAEEFMLSQQKKIRKVLKGTYSDIVRSILRDYLGINNELYQIGNISDTEGIHEILIPNLSPFDAIEYVTKRASSSQGVPDYLFWQTQLGYNFMSVSQLFSYDAVNRITFGAKNILDDAIEETMGARDFRIVSQFDAAGNIKSGVYAGKFIGYDTLTRTIQVKNIGFNDLYKLSNHANKNPIDADILNKDNNKASEMYDSRITVYPFQLPRLTNSYLKTSDSKTSNIVDDVHNYILQRRAIFHNLMQKKVRITMPGNFGLYSGSLVFLDFPQQFNIDSDANNGDGTLYGKYIITNVRHIIRSDKHETILEVATDSNNFGK